MRRVGKARDIRVGVVGYGGAFHMGRHHIREMRAAGMTPAAVTDIDADRLAVAEQDFPGIQTYTSTSEMLKKSDVNLVTLITPHNTHAKLALECLGAGRHVCCEKPLAITTAECDRMIAAAKKNRLVLTTYHNRHWDGCILEAVQRVKRQRVIGEIIRIEAHMGRWGCPGDWWRSSKSISGGILYDWGVHLLEYSLQLIDSDIREVTAVSKSGFWAPKTVWKADTNEDEAFALVRFKSGQWLTLSMTAIDANPKGDDRGQLEITGTRGTYLFAGADYTIMTHGQGQRTVTTGKNRPSQSARFYKNVANHLVKGTKLVITPQWARRPIHILDLAEKSARKGRAVRATYT